jgi:hypothetical protein
MTEVQDIPEMTEVQDIPEMTEVQDIPEMTEEKSQQLQLALIVVPNVKFHLFQEITNPSIVVIVSDKTNHRILKPIDIPEMTEVQDIPEMTEVQDIPEMTEVQDIPEMTEAHVH